MNILIYWIKQTEKNEFKDFNFILKYMDVVKNCFRIIFIIGLLIHQNILEMSKFKLSGKLENLYFNIFNKLSGTHS